MNSFHCQPTPSPTTYPTTPSPPTTTTPCPWRTSPSTWVSPRAATCLLSSVNPGQTLSTNTISRGNIISIYNSVIIIDFIEESSTSSSTPSSSTSEEASPSSSLQALSVHLHLLHHAHQDGAVLQKRWRNSIGSTVLIIIYSSPGARTGFMILQLRKAQQQLSCHFIVLLNKSSLRSSLSMCSLVTLPRSISCPRFCIQRAKLFLITWWPASGKGKRQFWACQNVWCHGAPQCLHQDQRKAIPCQN